jgi:hypothetical protein
MATRRFNRTFARRIVIVGLIVLCLYVITVGAVPSIFRFTTDAGRLPWLAASPTAKAMLEAYTGPARKLSNFVVFRATFEFSAACWAKLLDPPETTG